MPVPDQNHEEKCPRCGNKDVIVDSLPNSTRKRYICDDCGNITIR